ncbi:acyl-CoA dehydrogenase [Serratia sp. MYb239]|uniref:acyl-CoA dehydrogenase family protein n=1 Tax=Serratia sp. MYb239 TaxID=2033438 RepID=UPI000CF651FA|nr:acyl-CoA dehydrogenase family protein [Serratia sp. MYb239]AVJ18375.1 acyl-CoA dehydrogenase [Serratia sp. MYb239]
MSSVQSIPLLARRQRIPAPLAQIAEQLAQQAAALDRSGEFPHANLALLHEYGLLGLACEQRYGGADANLPTLQQVVSAIAQGEPSTALIVCMQYLHHLRLAANPKWPEALRSAISQSAVQHGALINSLRVEPELGSPARGGLPRTVATRTSAGWRLNGHKLYTTGIDGLSWLAIWARSDDANPQVGTWLVPRNSPGITIKRSWDHLGMRASGSHEVILHDVAVPLSHAADIYPADRPPPPDTAQIRAAANAHAALLPAIYDGVAQAARRWLIAWLQQRTPTSLGAPLASLARVQETVGQIDGLLLVNQSLLRQAAAQAFSTEQANLAKVTITENAIAAVEKALTQSGNHGLTRHNPLERHYRNVLCGRVHTPQNDSAWIKAGQAALRPQDDNQHVAY